MVPMVRNGCFFLACLSTLALFACQSSPGSGDTDAGSERPLREKARVLTDADSGEQTRTDSYTETTQERSLRERGLDGGVGDRGQEPTSERDGGLADQRTAGCQSRVKQPQNKLWITTMGLSVRRYIVHVPKGYDPKKRLPLVFNIHGHSSADWQQLVLTDLNKKSDKEGFLVVHPQSGTVPPSWNADGCCPPANTLKTKDLEFFKKMLKQVQEQYCVDSKRIYSTGMSNGGMMSYKLACELSDKIVAIAPVAGAMVPRACKPKRPLSVMAFHGTADLIVPYKGSKVLGFPSTLDSVQFWIDHNRCPQKSNTVFAKDDVRCERWGPCAENTSVVLCTVDRGGHTWPGGFPLPTGKTTRTINATDELWKFFKPLRLP